MNKELEKRMYFFVPYNLSPIQQAIQAGHAALEYARKYKDDEEFIDFADNWKTWVILNGGTTNSKGKTGANYRKDEEPYLGTLDNLAHQLIKNNINYEFFKEPDLNDALTAVCFICDERVFNYEDYPDIREFIVSQQELPYDIKKMTDEGIIFHFPDFYKEWQTYIMGGEKNVFLRNLLKGKKLA